MRRKNVFLKAVSALAITAVVLFLAGCSAGGSSGGSSGASSDSTTATELWSLTGSDPTDAATLTLAKSSSGAVSSALQFTYYDADINVTISGTMNGTATISSQNISISGFGTATGSDGGSATCSVSASGMAQDGSMSLSATMSCPDYGYTATGSWTGARTSGSGITFDSSAPPTSDAGTMQITNGSSSDSISKIYLVESASSSWGSNLLSSSVSAGGSAAVSDIPPGTYDLRACGILK